MKTEIKSGRGVRIELLSSIERPAAAKVPPDFAADNGQWLVEKAQEHLGATGVSYALIHADDGVLWARVTANRLEYPPASDWSPRLRSATVQQCRLFGDRGELFLWREADEEWRGRILIEEPSNAHFFFEELHVLSGSRVHSSQPAPTGFTAVFEPTTGIRQIVPLNAIGLAENRRVTLTVVNYLARDKDGQARIFCSRLKTVNAPALI